MIFGTGSRRKDVNNKYLKRFIYALGAISLIVALVVISVEMTIYNDSFFENEYKKYRVNEDLGMKIEDVIDVSEQMMDYLKDERDDLVIYTTLRGQYREFFNDREKSHMIDVKNLLENAIRVRTGSIITFVLCIILLLLMKDKVYYGLSKAFLWTTGIVPVIILLIAFLIMIGDFTKYWEMFHNIFFSNDLWLLDPNVDMMILMLPEEFFVDLIVRSVVHFGVFLVILSLVSILLVRFYKKKNNGGHYE